MCYALLSLSRVKAPVFKEKGGTIKRIRKGIRTQTQKTNINVSRNPFRDINCSQTRL